LVKQLHDSFNLIVSNEVAAFTIPRFVLLMSFFRAILSECFAKEVQWPFLHRNQLSFGAIATHAYLLLWLATALVFPLTFLIPTLPLLILAVVLLDDDRGTVGY
jgi:hypothetical protein